MTGHEDLIQERPPEARATRLEWAGLLLLLLPMLVLATDLTVLFFAMPTLSAGLHPTATQSLWITHVYGFVIAGFLVTMGRLSDRVGPRRLLLIGSAAFAGFSVLAAFSTTPMMLIVARALMGVAGATLMPSLFSLLRTMFRDDAQRRLAIAIMFSGFTAGGAIGPVLGGVLLEFFWWGSVFLINVPLLLALLLAGPVLLPQRSDTRSASGSVDAASVLMSVLGVLALVYGLQELAAAADSGAARTRALVVAVAGLAALILFVRRQRRLRDPLLDLAVLADRRIATSLATLLLVGVGVVGIFFLFTQYLQWVVDLSPLEAGFWTVPYIVVNIAGALIAPRLASTLRPPVVIAGGLIVVAIGAAILVVVADAGTPAGILVAGSAVIAFGHGLAMALVSDQIISNAPAERAGSAAAAQEVGGELGSAAGIALGGTVALVVYRMSMAAHLPPSTPPWARAAAGASPPDGILTAERLASDGAALLTVVRDAVASGLRAYAGVGMALTVIAATLVITVLARRRDAPTET